MALLYDAAWQHPDNVVVCTDRFDPGVYMRVFALTSTMDRCVL